MYNMFNLKTLIIIWSLGTSFFFFFERISEFLVYGIGTRTSWISPYPMVRKKGSFWGITFPSLNHRIHANIKYAFLPAPMYPFIRNRDPYWSALSKDNVVECNPKGGECRITIKKRHRKYGPKMVHNRIRTYYTRYPFSGFMCSMRF
ncbi:hypothetical protein QTP88_026619 [Uroleucon formosanum]